MAKAINSETRGSGPRQFAGVQPRFVGCLFAALMVVHALGFLVLGIGRSGLAFSEIVLSFDTLLAIACAGIAYRRARGVIAIFWFLFVIDLVVLLVPTVIEAYENISGQIILSESICGLLYSLYGAPILMMLFLPDSAWSGTRGSSQRYSSISFRSPSLSLSSTQHSFFSRCGRCFPPMLCCTTSVSAMNKA
jgi:hypothetical protein